MKAHIEIKHSFDAFDLDARLDFEDGVTALSGPSGSGKTTLIRAVAGLFRPDHAVVDLDGDVLADTANGVWTPPHKRRIGVVFQDARLFPHMSVSRNLEFGQRFSEASSDITKIPEMLGIDHLMDRSPRDLSGGETQRVALGRAILGRPRLLLMDEPLAALDAARKNEILPYLERFRAAGGPPILYVTHAMDEILRLADRLVLIRSGGVTRQGALADLLADPAAVRDLGPRAAGAILTATLSNHDIGDGLSELTTSAGQLFLPQIDKPTGTRLRVRISASDIVLARDRPDRVSALNILKAHIDEIHQGHGPGAAIALRSGSDRLLARITGRSVRQMGLKPGMTCYALIKSVSVAPGDVNFTEGFEG